MPTIFEDVWWRVPYQVLCIVIGLYIRKSRLYMWQHSTAKGYIKNKSCLNEEKEITGMRCNKPQQQRSASSGRRWRTAAALMQYSCSNSRIPTQWAAAEIHGRLYTKFNTYLVLVYVVQQAPYCETTHGAEQKEMEKKNGTHKKGSTPGIERRTYSQGVQTTF